MRHYGGEKIKRVVRTYLPIAAWLPQYDLTKLQCDIVAGLTVGLMVIPQGLACASIAGLPVEYGLYSSFMGCFVYCFLGTSKDVTIGPTALISVFVNNAVYLPKGYTPASATVPYAVMLTLFCGAIQTAMGVLKLGFLVRFISIPVISGFTSAAAIFIVFCQVKNILGLHGISRELFVFTIRDTFMKIGDTNKWDLMLGLFCIVLLICLRKLNQIRWSEPWEVEDLTVSQKIGRKIIWFVSVGRNALAISIATSFAFVAENRGYSNVFTLTGEIKDGVPEFKFPRMPVDKNNITVSSEEMIKHLSPGLLIIPLIGFLSNIAIAKAFARKNKYKIDPSQELIALGIANLMSSFVSSYPVAGSFSRTAVNEQSGVATPAGGIFTGAIVLLALGVLTPFFKYIPKASLAALIITSVITMVEYRIIKKIWKVRKIDLVPFFVTLVGCFWEMEYGILCGMAVSLIILLYPIVLPKIIDRQVDHTLSLLKIKGGLSFPGINHLSAKIEDISFQESKPKIILLDFSLVTQMDFSVTQGLLMIIEDVENKKIPIHFIRVHDNIRDIMVNSGIDISYITQNLDSLIETGKVNFKETNLV